MSVSGKPVTENVRASLPGALSCGAEDVEFVACEKCEKRMRFAAYASWAKINLARLTAGFNRIRLTTIRNRCR